MNRFVVAQFQKASSGRLSLWSLTTIEVKGEYRYRTIYNVDESKRYGYIFHQSGCGGRGPVQVDGIYFASGDVRIKETPCRLLDPRDRPPGKRTRAIRKRNRTRRLLNLPPAFDVDGDLLDWLERNGIQEDAIYCSECQDNFPGTGMDDCEHCWWCDKTGTYSTPSERCDCNGTCDE